MNPDEFPSWDEFVTNKPCKPCPVWAVVVLVIALPTLAAWLA